MSVSECITLPEKVGWRRDETRHSKYQSQTRITSSFTGGIIVTLGQSHICDKSET